MVTSTDQPTNQQGEYRAICLFRKLENRKKAEICNFGNVFASLRRWTPVLTYIFTSQMFRSKRLIEFYSLVLDDKKALDLF